MDGVQWRMAINKKIKTNKKHNDARCKISNKCQNQMQTLFQMQNENYELASITQWV